MEDARVVATDHGMDAQVKPNQRRAAQPGDPMYAISRTPPNRRGTGGVWRVRIARLHIRLGARFADRHYATSEQALLAAQAFRDVLLSRLDALLLAPGAGKRLAAVGRPRVCRSVRNGKPYWTAKYRTPDRQYSRRFSIDRFGAGTAHRLAVKASLQLAQQYGGSWSAPALPTPAELVRIKQHIRAQYQVAVGHSRCGEYPYHDDPMYGIYRHDSGDAGTGGSWRVALSRRRRIFEKRFADVAYGGAEPALMAARAYRDQVQAAVQPLSRREQQATLKSNNRSGVPGVHRYATRGYEYWVAKTVVDGKVKVRRFNIAKYGDGPAFDMAVNARKHMLAQVQGHYLFSPAAKTAVVAAAVAGNGRPRRDIGP